MSEKEELKQEIILPDAVVSIKLSTGFYQRLQAVLNNITSDKSEAEIKAAYEQIRNKDIKEPWIIHMETMFIILKDFQLKAKEDGFVKSMTKTETEAYIKEKFPDIAEQIKKSEENSNPAMEQINKESDDKKASLKEFDKED